MNKKVIIVDDDPIVVDSMKMILESGGYEVSGTGSSGKDAVRLKKEVSPDVVIMDIRMGEYTGLDAAEEILKDDPLAKILLITTFRDDEYIEKAIKSGCCGYLLKQNIKGLFPALQSVLSGQMVLDREVIEKIPSVVSEEKRKTDRKTDESKTDEMIPGLTPRELDIMKEISKGLSNREISRKLYLSEGTVRNYVSELLDKLGLRDRTQLAIFYIRNIEGKTI